MLIKVKYFFIIFCTLIVAVISGCDTSDKNVLKVGTIAGPETELMYVAKDVAKQKFNLDIKIVEFTDYIQPNTALNDGSLDANIFQHQPFLDQQIKDRNYKLIAVGKTFVYPMGVYSHKIKSIDQLSVNSIIIIPNDPSNEGRALLLLQKAGLIKLKNPSALFSVVQDIKENPKNIKFKELDAAQLSRSLPDADAVVINTNYAIPAGLSPSKDAIFLEDKDSPYANIIVVRANSASDPRIKQLVESFQSEAVLQAAKKIFNDQAITAW